MPPEWRRVCTGVELRLIAKGGYNVSYRLKYEDGTSVVMRVPIKGVFCEYLDTVRYEVATMKYVAANTTVSVPHIYKWGTAAENPLGLGPFIIMDYVEHHQRMSFAIGRRQGQI
ncbi:phosphotransferase family protein [Ophiostoma piceae UAMH 11346]|uniref:Phosphotransferase family protein n=1 Tax=Ophiostoma piceae (strain UAMH 11346) TaxID=1262450 RepID=S3C442_OPHP1|nr:phosphotransferase family protein [Ophiostoma piceae UAMH 11346]